jgi:hypothetical protein
VGLVTGAAVGVAATTVVLVSGSLGGHVGITAAGLAPMHPPRAAQVNVAGAAVSHADSGAKPVAFARARGITLYLPTPDPVAVAYHEASFHDALALHPLGHVVRDANRWKFRPPARTPGLGYIVMSSRGRSTPATSAADVVLRPSWPVHAPVTGRVIDVRPYRLYCRYADVEVRIRPTGQTRLSVIMIHLSGVRVHRGEPVFATLSVIGYPRVFPFRSQVDDYVRGGNPHVHIEITRPHPARRTPC